MTRRKRDTFGARLRQLREDADWTQDQLVARLAAAGVVIGRSYISELERTDKLPNGEVVAGLARALRCSADYLLGLSDATELPTDAAAAGEQARGNHADRLAELVANGFAMLDTPDVAQANAWLRQRVRVWAADNVVTEVEWL